MSCCRPSHEQKRERPFAALRVTLLERCPGCHPERSAGSLRQARQTFAEFTLSAANGLRVTAILSKRLKCPPKT